MPDARRFILSGEREAGKTTLLLELRQRAQQAGLDVGGVISPAVFRDGIKIGIDLLDVRRGEQTRLANLNNEETRSEIPTIHWAFIADALQHGNEILAQATPCDLLIVDELGPIELLRGQGWQSGIEAIESGAYQTAVIVIRPSLVEIARTKWPDAKLLKLDSKDVVQQNSIIQTLLGTLH